MYFTAVLQQSIRSFLSSLHSDVCIIRWVKNKGTVWLKPIFFVVYFLLSYFMFCFCFSCWLNDFPSFVRSLKDKHRLPLGSTILEHTHHTQTRFDAWAPHAQTRGPARRVWLRTLPSRLSLHPCTGAERALCWWKIIYQSLWWHCSNLFSPNVTFKGGSLLTHYCSKATEPRNCLGQLNEVPIMNAMIKFPLGAVTNPQLTSPQL